MNKYLSIIFLYNRASHQKLLLLALAIPVLFLAIFLIRIGNPYEAGPSMLMERGFGGIFPVLVFIAVNLLGIIAVSTSLNGRKSLRATSATTGYTVRRLCMPPISAYTTVFIYYIAVTLIFWAVTIASLYAIGRMGLTMSGAEGLNTKLALGLLRTEIGHALIPIAHPAVIIFNIIAILALAAQCARSCYLSWHGGTPSAGVLFVVVLMFLVWMGTLEEHFILMALTIFTPFAAFTFGDIIFREKRPKGDPFKVNKYEGILDYDSMEFDDDVYTREVNSLVDDYDEAGTSLLEKYGRGEQAATKKGLKKIDLAKIRRRYMPLGYNLEKANYFFGICIFIGFAEHLIFFFKYQMELRALKESIKGITIDAGVRMPYFWDLQEHTYYGYIVAILLVLFLQAHWNYEYYNKKTKSVYVMKRLPDRKEYSRTIWIAPIMQACAIAIIMVLHTVVDLLLYVLVTPDIAFYPDYLSHILPF